jgi:YfiH family protein
VTPETDRLKGERRFDWSPSDESEGVIEEAVGLPVLRVPEWRRIPRLQHGFLGRRGGSSIGARHSLNLSVAVSDDPAALRMNWNAVRAAIPALAVVRMRQIHGERIVLVRDARQQIGEADGLMSDVAGLALTVLTADCVPLLMVSPSRPGIAAVHAGWRGTLAGIADSAIRTGKRELDLEPAEWQIAMGPSINGCCYEVDAEIGARLESRWGRMPDAWSRVGRKGQLDLREANRAILVRGGVRPESIFAIGPCTACAHTDFFSHRKSRGESGRQASYLGWTGEE